MDFDTFLLKEKDVELVQISLKTFRHQNDEVEEVKVVEIDDFDKSIIDETNVSNSLIEKLENNLKLQDGTICLICQSKIQS